MSTKQRSNEFSAKGARIALAVCLVAAVAQAHVSVSPQQSKTGGTEHYVVRVPTEGSVSTVSVDLEIPAGVIVGEIAATPDARYEVTREGARIAAVKWTIEIKPGSSAQLSFSAQNPAGEGSLVWKAHQHFADGTTKEWVPATKLTSTGPSK